MTLLQSQLRQILDRVLRQDSFIRKGGTQALYFCKCGHYKRKLEIKLDPPFLAHCWVCNYSANLYGLLKTYNASKSYYDQVQKLTGSIKRNYAISQINKTTELVLPSGFIPLSISRDKDPEYKNAMVYLKNRGVTLTDIVRYNIGYCGFNDPYEYHVIVPSYDAKGNLNFFMGRRYYESEGTIPHKKPEASMDIVGFEIFVNYNEPLNLCEGVFDALAIRNNAVPLFGKYPSSKLREKMIVNKTKRVNMILDNDAIDDAIKNCKMMMKLGIEVCLVRLNGKDPSVLGFEKTHELIRNAKPLEFEDLLKYELGL